MGYRCSSAGLQRRDAVLTPQSSVQRGRCEQPNGNVTAITMSPRRVALFFAIVVLSLSIIHAAGQFSRFFLDDGYLHGIVPMFTFGAEHNVPAYYSALAIFFCALLLAIIAIGERARAGSGAGYWWGLAAIFLYLSFDEALALHERMVAPTQMLLGVSADRYFVWLLPYALVMLVIAIPYARFVLWLPVRTRRRFVLAGIVFLSGAVGLEIVGGLVHESLGQEGVTFVILESLEDLLEMVGIVIFIYALMCHIVARHGELRLLVAANPRQRREEQETGKDRLPDFPNSSPLP
jgi:hypothetical protein